MTIPIHRRTHAEYVEGCDACRWLTVSISANALEVKGKPVRTIEARQKRWDKDGDAYKRLRGEGIQPTRIDGSDKVEAKAESKEQIETGLLHVKPESFENFGDIFGHKATEPQVKPLDGG